MQILAEIQPLDPVTVARPVLRVCSVEDRRVTALNNQVWRPAMVRLPELSMQWFGGDFEEASDLAPGQASFAINTDVLALDYADIARCNWQGAAVTLWAGDIGQAWPWTKMFVGRISEFGAEAARLALSCSVDTDAFARNVLTASYAGTGGKEGSADLKDKPKPLLFGRCINVEPVRINAVDSVYQVSAYGPINQITAVYERADAFPAALADYPTYAALVAASIPAGQWATCLAEGMFRLGAPAYGLITVDAEGHVSGTWLSRTGSVIAAAASIAGVPSEQVDATALTNLDTEVSTMTSGGGIIGAYLDSQTSVIDLAKRLAKPLNAMAGVSLLGMLTVARISIGTPALTLDAQGRALPAVTAAQLQGVSPPYKRLAFGAQRVWRVQSADEIAIYETLIPIYATSEDPPANPQFGQGWKRPSDGRLFVFTGQAITSGATYVTSSGTHLLASGWVEVRDAGVEDALDTSGTATDTATSTATDVGEILSDGILSAEEKPAFITEMNALLGEKSGLDTQATNYSITTEKTAYDSAVTALQTELDLLYVPYRWDSLSGKTELGASPLRDLILDVYTTRRTLTTKIADLARLGLNADGTVKDDKVTNPSVVNNSITRSGSIAGDLGGYRATSPAYGTWRDFSDGSVTAEISLTTAATGDQKVKLTFVVAAKGDGSDADNTSWRVLRNGTQIGTTWDDIQILDGRITTQTFIFWDDAPADATTYTYKVQYMPIASDGFPYLYNFSFDAVLTAK